MDEELTYLIKTLIEGQTRTDETVRNLATVLNTHMDFTEARDVRADARMQELEEAHLRTEEAITNLATTVDKYITSADARMKQIEANLDGLIRAITREHTSGKAQLI